MMTQRGWKRVLARHTKQKNKDRLLTSSSVSVGPLELNLEMTRDTGWSLKQLERVSDAITKMSRRENHIAHRNGPVPGCKGVECDRGLATVTLCGLNEYSLRIAVIRALKRQKKPLPKNW